MDRIEDGLALSGLTQLDLVFEHQGIDPGYTAKRPQKNPRTGQTDGTLRRVRLASGELSYRFVRARRRSIGISVSGGQIEARAPHYVRISEVEAFIRQKERWVVQRLAESRLAPPAFRWQMGADLPLLGRTVRLCTEPGATGVALLGERLVLPAGNPEHWRRQTLEWLQAGALALFRERMGRYAAALSLPLPGLALSNARTRWGSCKRVGRDGARILLHWRLYHLPLRLIDYVVVHELAHLKELNHSPRFWAVVARAVPDYLEARRELNRLGRSLAVL